MLTSGTPEREAAEAAGLTRGGQEGAAAAASDVVMAAGVPEGTAAPNPWARFGWIMACVWLIFMFYPVTALLNSQAETAWVVAGWAGTVVFVALYLVMFAVGIKKGVAGVAGVSGTQYLLLAALLGSVAVTIPAIGASATSFFPFLVSVLAYQFTRLVYWIGAVVCVGIVVAIVIVSPDGTEYIALLAILTILVLINAVSTWLILRSMVADKLAIDLATSEGREAVARDVHDLLGHSLTVVKLKAQLARRLVDVDPARAKAELEEIERITGEAIDGVRATVTGLRTQGLAVQLDAARASLATAGIELSVDGDPAVLSPAQSLPAGWILREAVTNVLRHSRASRVSVTLRPGEMLVEDDGVGAGSTEAGGKAAVLEGNGLRGMAERASAAGGRCSVRRGEGTGTIVEVAW